MQSGGTFVTNVSEQLENCMGVHGKDLATILTTIWYFWSPNWPYYSYKLTPCKATVHLDTYPKTEGVLQAYFKLFQANYGLIDGTPKLFH